MHEIWIVFEISPKTLKTNTFKIFRENDLDWQIIHICSMYVQEKREKRKVFNYRVFRKYSYVPNWFHEISLLLIKLWRAFLPNSPKKMLNLSINIKPESHTVIMDTFEGFQHIGEKIFNCLTAQDLLNCRLTSKSWKNVLDNPTFWLKNSILLVNIILEKFITNG